MDSKNDASFSKYTVSLIIPVYNTENYVKECVESAVFQSVPFYEIIIINDGSTDGCEKICTLYEKNYSNIHLISQKNQGLSASRNLGIENAHGDYVMFLDSDDFLKQDSLKNILHLLNGQDVVYFSADIKNEFSYESQINKYVRNSEVCNRCMSGWEFLSLTLYDNYISQVCLGIYSRLFLNSNNIRFPVGLYYEDHYFYLQVLFNGKKIYTINDICYVHRIRSDSIITTPITEKKCNDICDIFMLIWHYLVKKIPYIWQHGLWSNYVIFMMRVTLYYLDRCVSSDSSRIKKEWEKKLLDICWRRIAYSDMCLSSYCELYYTYEDLQGTEDTGVSLVDVRLLYNNIVESIKSKIIDLPLSDKDLCVGIYGIGEHTKILELLYRKYVGDIQAKIYYIISNRACTLYNGKNVVTPDFIPKDTDYIIISSLKYMREMKRNLLKIGVLSSKIILIYNLGEIHDIVSAYNIIRVG